MTASQSGADDERLLSLADQGVVDILDMEFIARDADGGLSAGDLVAALDATELS